MWNLFVALIAVLVYVFTSDFFKQVNPVKYTSQLPEKFSGGLATNELLDKAERLHENNILWPESFAEYKGQLYTGLGDGRIVRITDKEVVPITRTGKDCEGIFEEHICGRPLGMTFNKEGRLFVADAYHGLFSIDINTGKKVNILPSKTIVEDLPLTLLNSLTFDDKEENLYITQSSSRWNISHVIVSIIEHDTSGRLLKFNMKTKKVSVLLKDLAFPNGVVLSHDKNALLVAEGMQNKVFKYHIGGPKKGLNEELSMLLPGEPDNLKRSKNGYWVTVATARSQENPTLLDRFSDKPFWRALLLHIHRLTTLPISTVLKFVPDKRAKEIGFELLTGRLIADYLLDYGLVLEFDDKGNILRSFHSPSGKITHLSEAFEHNGYLYLGSWRNKYLGRLKL
ncbi:adipocyte plasma membrane-associated protein-like isoform X2 [Argiope bruennichi]|nr:adipocyte plasma membrane-associated protein-like isoform X2 [Argiope bruennichi]XP_055945477.1 adipocyte plasma membrane-associated protein-like isoform X2 [Argiope bruennichi]XP_055945478.1 adipocyte plasma membrane-associated protein-like isoform X2 [Argiope bruennichi]